MKEDLKILMLEDDAFDYELNMAHILKLDEYNCQVNWVKTRADYLNILQNDTPDIILSDYSLPGYTGLEALLDLKELNLLIPFIFVTGTLNEETAAQAIKTGAWDYVVKDRLFRLPLAIKSTLQVKKERELAHIAEEQNRKLSMAVEQSPSHIIITDTLGRIEYSNARFTEVTGYTAEEAKGSVSNIFNPVFHKDDTYDSIISTLNSGHEWRGEFLNVRKDNVQFWEHVSISPLKDENGKITHYISVKEDITLRKKMEKEIIEARDRAERSDKLKEAFLQNLSHEIRTPLNAIVGFLSLMNETCPATKCESSTYIDYVMQGADQLTSIISDIIDLSQLDAKTLKVVEKKFDIVQLIDKVYASYQGKIINSQIQINLHKKISENNICVSSDEFRITQIVNNLISNAIKFTSQGNIDVYLEKDHDGIRISVKDSGIGIAQENFNLIFQRFRQIELDLSRRYGGLGVGLTICKELADLLGARIWFDSEIDKGSIFYLHIPYVRKAESTSVEVVVAVKPITLNKILVAEDDVNNYIYINELLKAIIDKTAQHAWDGREAVDMVEAEPDFDLILMDIRMPVMDGIAAFHEIKQKYPHIPIVAVTAYAFDSEKESLLVNGFDGYLAKPFQKSELQSILTAISNLKNVS